MNSRLELGRIAGIPIVLDMMFVLILVVFSSHYFTSGDSQFMSAGLLIIAGIIASILLHELGHAFMARLFKTGTTEIALTGMGGVAQFSSSLPKSALPRVLIYLAGPAANLLLWLGFGQLAVLATGAGKPVVLFVLLQLASINYFLMWFNLLPAYPLDGGHTLDAVLGKIVGPTWTLRVVGALGIVIALFVAFMALRSLPSGLFLLLFAFWLAETNWAQFQSAGAWRRRR